MRNFIQRYFIAIERLASIVGAFGLGAIILSAVPNGLLVGGALVFAMACTKVFLHEFAQREARLGCIKSDSGREAEV